MRAKGRKGFTKGGIRLHGNIENIVQACCPVVRSPEKCGAYSGPDL